MRALLYAALMLSLAPTLASAGPPPGVKVEPLLDETSTKVVRITIAPKGELPAHSTPVHATVAAMAGAGEVTIGDKKHPLPTHGAVFLPKQIPHSVTNTGDAPLVLLVHHLKGTK